MAVSFNQVKTYIPGVGYRAYIWSLYTQQGLLCEPNQLGTGMWECLYLFGEGEPHDSWQGGGMGPLNGIFPNIGEWVSVEIVQPLIPHSYILCYKLLEIVDEATFTTGTCTSCYNHGYGGQCSDAFITVPPLPGDPAGCLYTNLINPQGIVVGTFGVVGNPSYTYTAWISSNCNDCTGHVPPVFEPNMIVNCCDPSERYVLDPTAPSPFSSTPPIYDQLTVPYTTSTLGVGIVNYQEAFAANLYIDGGIGWLTSPPTSPKCWHLVNDPTPFGPTALSATIMNIGKRPSCVELNTAWLASNPIGVDTACCPPTPDDCEPPFVKLAKLTSKLDKFKVWKDKSLGK